MPGMEIVVPTNVLKPQMGALNFIEYFRAIDPEMPSQFVAVFLAIGSKPKISTKELMQLLDMSQSSMSRATRALSDRQLNGNEGHHLIVGTSDPLDSRILQWSLTGPGEALYAAIIATVSGEPAPRPDVFKRQKNKKENGGKLKPVLA